MTKRIVLSLLMAFGLCVAACDEYTASGVGTSPSGPADDDPIAVTAYHLEAPPACGVWIRDTSALADQASLAGEAPDLVAFAGEHATCIDAVTVAAERYPGRAFVRRVRQAFRAYEATCGASAKPEPSYVGASVVRGMP